MFVGLAFRSVCMCASLHEFLKSMIFFFQSFNMPKRKCDTKKKINKKQRWKKYPHFIASSNDSDFVECTRMQLHFHAHPTQTIVTTSAVELASPHMSPIAATAKGKWDPKYLNHVAPIMLLSGIKSSKITSPHVSPSPVAKETNSK